MFFKGIVEELLWIISGSTDSTKLAKKGVHIWDDNGSKKNLENIGLGHREEGDLGPIYGFQWRHFGDTYKTMHDKYVGFDQLSHCIHLIKTDPTSRRIILSAWNPLDIDRSALPPCHILYQFFVHNNELSCLMYQRSGDLGMIIYPICYFFIVL